MLKVAVVIPVKNSARTIVHCLESVLNQTYPDLFGIWIVGDKDNDNTWEAIRDISNHPLIHSTHVIKPANWVGRDANLKRLQGTKMAIANGADIVVLLDSQVYAQTNWIENGVYAMKLYNVDVVAGITRRDYEDRSFVSVFENEALISEFPLFKPDFILTRENFGEAKGLPNTANLFMSKTAITKIVDEWPIEPSYDWDDFVLDWIMVKHGLRIFESNDVVVYRNHIRKLRLMKQIASGMGYVQFAQKHPDCPYIYTRLRSLFLVLGMIRLIIIPAIAIILTRDVPTLLGWTLAITILVLLVGIVQILKAKDVRGIIFPFLIFISIILWCFGTAYLVSTRGKDNSLIASLLAKHR